MGSQKVRMKVSIASSDWSFYPGQIVELPVEIATAWCDCGHAEQALEHEVPSVRHPELNSVPDQAEGEPEEQLEDEKETFQGPVEPDQEPAVPTKENATPSNSKRGKK
jgi:hypothetical protein